MWSHDVTLITETAHEVHISAGQEFSFSCDPPCKKKLQTLQGLLTHIIKKRFNACKAGKENNCPRCLKHVQGSIAQHLPFCCKREHQRLEREAFSVHTCIYFHLMVHSK